MERKIKNKRLVKAINISAVGVFFFGIASMMICGYLQERGYGNFLWPMTGLILFFSCDVLALIMLAIVFKDTMYYDIEGKSEKYGAMDLLKVANLSEVQLKEKLLKNKFKERDGGYFRRKKFTPAKDFICYFVKAINAVDLESTIDKEFEAYNELQEKSSNTCLVLVLYKNRVQEKDLQDIKEYNTNLIIWETVGQDKPSHSSIIVLVDTFTKDGYFLDMNSKMGISIYAHGCRLLKRIFKES